jgi:uncharacterized protein (DUF1015 family)
MANIYPFRGLRYSLKRIPIEKVLTQPYDKISREMQDRYYALHPNNIIRIVLGRPEEDDSSAGNVYTRAAHFLKDWRADGTLAQLQSPAFYVYFQRFIVPGTTDVHVRKGFVGLTRLEDYANKVVFPHERTLTGPKIDRLELLRNTRTHFEQIFLLYEDPTQRIDRILDQVAEGKPEIDVEDEYGVAHSVWTVKDPAIIRTIQEHTADKKLIIADGHHRYETALAYRDEMRQKHGMSAGAPHERLTAAFFNMNSPGLTILPTHRVLSGLGAFVAPWLLRNWFDVVEAPTEPEPFRIRLRELGGSGVTIGVTADGGKSNFLLSLKPTQDLAALMPDLSPKQRLLDVVVLHRLIIEKGLGITEEAVKKETHITYVREMGQALNAVRSQHAELAFLLNPTRLEQLRDIAYEGNVMPQKSTDFYPKVLSGLMMYALDEE